MEITELKGEDKSNILADLRYKVQGNLTYVKSEFKNLDELFVVVPFDGFCSVIDNIRFLYKEIGIPLPIWFKEKYSHLFDKNYYQ